MILSRVHSRYCNIMMAKVWILAIGTSSIIDMLHSNDRQQAALLESQKEGKEARVVLRGREGGRRRAGRREAAAETIIPRLSASSALGSQRRLEVEAWTLHGFGVA